MCYPITNVATVKARAQIPENVTTFDDMLTVVVNAVNARIPEVCSRNFTYQIYAETRNGYDNNQISLRNGPVETVFYAGGVGSAPITVTYNGTALGVIEVEMDDGGCSLASYKVKLIEGLSVTELLIEESDTIADIVNKINSEANWGCELIDSTYAGYTAYTLTPRVYAGVESGDEVNLFMANRPFRITPLQDANGEYNADSSLSSKGLYTVIYQGGYQTIPANLADAAAQLALNTFRQAQNDQTLKGEKIGNYSWTAAVGEYLSEQLPAWYSTLNNFKNVAYG
jgi:hypothetical protein